MFLFIIFLKILGILLSLIFLLLIFLLFVPFKYSLYSHINEQFFSQGTISWMFNLFKLKISQEKDLKIKFFILNKLIFSTSKDKILDENVKKNNKKPRCSNKICLKNVIKEKIISCVISYFKDVLKIIKPDEIKINGTYGFYDPSITGFLCGFIPLIMQIVPKSNINLNPVFDHEIIDIKANAYGKVFLFSIIIRTLKLILKKDVRKTLFKKSKTIET